MKGKKKTTVIIAIAALAVCVCGGFVLAYSNHGKEVVKSLADITTVIETGQITGTEMAKFEQARADVEKELEAEKKAAEAKKKAAEAKKKAEAEAVKKKVAEEAAAKAEAEEAAKKQAVASANRGSSNSGNSSKSTTSGKQYSGKKSSSGKTSDKKSTKTNNKAGGSSADKSRYYPVKNVSGPYEIDPDGNTCYEFEW